MNASLTCLVYNKTFTNIDETECNILRTAAFLFYYDFGYICMAPIGLIIVISIFGQLKGHYRWFILNQAMWDLFVSSNYSCNNIMGSTSNPWVKPVPLCFYSPLKYNSINAIWLIHLGLFVNRVILTNSYSALLLLSTSRFTALYYPHTYSKLIKGRKILYTIILFNFIAILLDIYPLFQFLQITRMQEVIDECVIQKNLTIAICTVQKVYEKDYMYNFYTTSYQYSSLLQNFKPPLFLFLSVIAVIMVILKMAKQIKFQLQQDRRDITNTIRIAMVISLQVIINCFGVFLEAFNSFIPPLISLFQLKILTTRAFRTGQDYTGYLDLRLPLWLDGIYGLSYYNGRNMMIQFRILLEAFIVLFIMTGYREAIIDFINISLVLSYTQKKVLKA